MKFDFTQIFSSKFVGKKKHIFRKIMLQNLPLSAEDIIIVSCTYDSKHQICYGMWFTISLKQWLLALNMKRRRNNGWKKAQILKA